MRAYEPASFRDRWENATAVIILLRFVAVLVLDSKGLYISMPAHERTDFFYISKTVAVYRCSVQRFSVTRIREVSDVLLLSVTDI